MNPPSKPIIRIRPKVVPKTNKPKVEESDLDQAFNDMNLDPPVQVRTQHPLDAPARASLGKPFPLTQQPVTPPLVAPTRASLGTASSLITPCKDQAKKLVPLPFTGYPKSNYSKIDINQDHFLEFIFMLSNEGKLNMNQVAYLTECMDSRYDLSVKLDEFNLRNSFLSWEAQLLREQQEKELQASILADKIKLITASIANKGTELAPHKSQLEALTDELEGLHVRYRNYPDNPRFAREKTRVESAINALKRVIIPYEEDITKLRLELEALNTKN